MSRLARMAVRQAWSGWRNGEFGVLLAALFVRLAVARGAKPARLWLEVLQRQRRSERRQTQSAARSIPGGRRWTQ